MAPRSPEAMPAVSSAVCWSPRSGTRCSRRSRTLEWWNNLLRFGAGLGFVAAALATFHSLQAHAQPFKLRGVAGRHRITFCKLLARGVEHLLHVHELFPIRTQLIGLGLP